MGLQVSAADMFRAHSADLQRRPPQRSDNERRSFDQDLHRIDRGRPSQPTAAATTTESNGPKAVSAESAPGEKDSAPTRKRNTAGGVEDSQTSAPTDLTPAELSTDSAAIPNTPEKAVAAFEPSAVIETAPASNPEVQSQPVSENNENSPGNNIVASVSALHVERETTEATDATRPAYPKPILPHKKHAGDAVDPRLQPAADSKFVDEPNALKPVPDHFDDEEPLLAARAPQLTEKMSVEKPSPHISQVGNAPVATDETAADAEVTPQPRQAASSPSVTTAGNVATPAEARPISELAQAPKEMAPVTKAALRKSKRQEGGQQGSAGNSGVVARPVNSTQSNAHSFRVISQSLASRSPEEPLKIEIRAGNGDATATTVAKFLLAERETSDAPVPHSATSQTASAALQNTSDTSRAPNSVQPANVVHDLLKAEVPVDESIRSAAQLLSTSRSQGEQQVTLQLDPPHLGRLRLEIRMHDQTMALRVDVENAHVARLIESRMPDLRDALAAHGIRVDQSEIAVKSPPAAENGNNAHNHNGSGAGAHAAHDDGGSAWNGHGGSAAADRESNAWNDAGLFGSREQLDENEMPDMPTIGEPRPWNPEYALDLVA